ncbi:MAG: hypothetical protein QXG00_00485 [Candidatus Woesearchaeota archaeon]
MTGEINIDIRNTLSFYKRADVRAAMIEHSKNKEVAVHFNEGFGKRPDILKYENDVLELAKQGALSFHCSEELWKNPLQLTTNQKKHELDDLRIGFDLIIDIDCKVFDYSKIAAYYTIKALQKYGVKSISVKFSGNKGFHIGVPFECFPEIVNKIPINKMFPEAPKRIALYLKYLISKPVSRAIFQIEKNVDSILQKTGLQRKDIIIQETKKGIIHYKINAEPFIEIDTVLISPRHMYRMPYSFHEKSGLISLPIDTDRLLNFTKEDARPENIKQIISFLDRKNAVKGEISLLLREAFDFNPKIKDEKRFEIKDKKFHSIQYLNEIGKKIPEEFFPDCIKKILNGLEDGRKRGLLILINFLSCMNWSYEDIEKRIHQWNEKNKEPLRENYVVGQLRYHKQNRKKVLPPNCDNEAYYKSLGVYCNNENHKRIKNPVQRVRATLREFKTMSGVWRKQKTEKNQVADAEAIISTNKEKKENKNSPPKKYEIEIGDAKD